MNSRFINKWYLFWLISLPLCAFMVAESRSVDLSTGDGVSHMIQYSVRFAVPFIYIVVAASALPVLFPGALSRWVLRNRRYLGLVFAVAMGWQGAFIFLMSSQHAGFYYDEVYLLRDELEGSSGYIFLAAMVATSFNVGRRHLSAAQWKTLHRSGIYFLWAYPFSVYWWNLFYYGNPQIIDYVFYWSGFAAFATRIAAWGMRRGVSAWSSPESLCGAVIIPLAVIAAATGGTWRESVSTALLAPSWSANLELWLPYWPFEPFLPLLALGLGTWLLTDSPTAVATKSPEALGR